MELKPTDSDKNATYLFGRPNSRFHSSEQFWSSLFALLILNLSNSEGMFQIPAYRFFQDKEKWVYKHDEYFVIQKGLKLENVVVDGKITDAIFPDMKPLSNELSGIRPDIFIHKDKRIEIIEVKTIGAHLLSGQRNNYLNLRKFFNENQFQVGLYFLLSIGHEKDNDWTTLQDTGQGENPFKILLWEDVLKCIDENTKEFKNSLGELFAFYKDKDLYLKGSFKK